MYVSVIIELRKGQNILLHLTLLTRGVDSVVPLYCNYDLKVVCYTGFVV